MYVGIDPSINSTGVCITLVDDFGCKVNDKFYVIKSNKLTKRESEEELNNINLFCYETYIKHEPNNKDDNHEVEFKKTHSFINIVSSIYSIIKKEAARNEVDRICICQEGISYGSTVRTKSVFDLAGLNFMIRNKLISYASNYIIATPAEIKKFATGKGNANKDLVILNFRTYYDESALSVKKIDDIADAFFMAQLALHNDREIYDRE